MKIEAQTSPEAVIAELGARIAHRRIELGMSQAEMATQGGVGKRTIERIEAGKDTQLSTLIRLLRILELTDRLDLLIPEAKVSPIERLKRQQQPPRQRAASKQKAKPKKPWKWGDE
ncbi:MAG: helix-turn-helix domain-containing protein [Planctomycetes bacterium]|nr:helix-turn-helix domain-containing protein [Planctomycetota bacterium]